jgi:hypothetical protein
MDRPIISRVIPVFIASPSDVRPERSIIDGAIRSLGIALTRQLGAALVSYKWEDFPPIAESRHPQHRILRQIRPDSIFIGVLYKRYGSKIRDLRGWSGTESEFREAIRQRERIKILTYFRRVRRQPTEDEARKQFKKVTNLKTRLKRKNLFCQEYDQIEELKDRITGDLLEATIEVLDAPEQTRKAAHASFFRLGKVHSRADERPSVLIVYPPIGRSEPRKGRIVSIDWQRHLLPPVVYEDQKTIQKLDLILREIGVRDIAAVTTSYRAVGSEEEGNRIWICVPRNAPAQQSLRQFGDRVRFQFSEKKFGRCMETERFLTWQNTIGDQVRVRTPLMKYLRMSKRPSGKQTWEQRYAEVYARDYGVLARFMMKGSNVAAEGMPFYQYFMAGIRGLGTWGVGWYADRYPDKLREMDEASKGKDVQVLLEVTYLDHRIISVIDVSDKSQDYFDERLNDSYVRRAIREQEAP